MRSQGRMKGKQEKQMETMEQNETWRERGNKRDWLRANLGTEGKTQVGGRNYKFRSSRN